MIYRKRYNKFFFSSLAEAIDESFDKADNDISNIVNDENRNLLSGICI